jgi:hypothetical protein
MPAPRRRITQDDVTELLSNLRASEQPPPEWCTANRLDGRSLRYWADRLPQLAAIRLVELARPGRATPEPLLLIPDGVVIDLPDVNIEQALAGWLWGRHAAPDLGRPGGVDRK